MSNKSTERFADFLRYKIHGYCNIAELTLAIVIGIVLVYMGCCYLLTVFNFGGATFDTICFQNFLKNIFNLVVGIEFIKMLLKPNAKNVIDEVIFLVTRHLIIDPISPAGILLCVICIILLYGFLFFIKYLRVKSSDFEKAMESGFANIVHQNNDDNT